MRTKPVTAKDGHRDVSLGETSVPTVNFDRGVTCEILPVSPGAVRMT